ncbi:MAG: hypothetical protein A2520_09260 [Deltaproteobacteria bacterium RIFOXYD12_FULL_53_23]|nr:MAG: hypothetical protein A2520_09260 [Deltaproteobacteria bacterium RIFOXYD12_FULL_53_23]
MTPQKKRISQLVFRSIVVGLAVGFAASAQANPVGPAVVSGSATIATSGNIMTVTNTPGAIINWQQFNIGQSEVLKFVQQSAQSSVLNRVMTQNPSQILGTLQSNGRVFLINPSGIMFGQGSIVNVNGLVASTLNISDSDFLLNRFNFIGSNVSSVINKGEITTPLGGSVYLIGNSVSNEGLITSPKGEVILAAGNSVSLLDTGTPNVTVTFNAPDNQAINLGQIVAESGQINIYGALLNQQGLISADSASLDAQGNIVLKATDTTTLSGKLSATNSQCKGGNIQVLGNTVNLTSTAQIDASGASGGGTVLVGGDYQGKNAAVQNAQVTYLAQGASIKADATDNGEGGKVIVWADEATGAFGTISARGGATGGNGGFVEVSGKEYLEFDAMVDTSAPFGKTGTLLLDPTDISIISGSAAPTAGSFTSGTFAGETASSSTISWGNIESLLTSNNVVIQTSSTGAGTGNISVNGSPSTASLSISHTDSWDTWSNTYNNTLYSSSNNLSLLAENAVNIYALFGNAGSGAITIIAGWNGDLSTPDLVASYTAGKNINLYSSLTGQNGNIIANGGALTLKAADTILLYPGVNRATIDMNTGALSLVANKISLDASSAANHQRASILSNGDQSFTLGRPDGSATDGLYLYGANGTGIYGGQAEIRRFGGSSGQSFTFNNGSDLKLYGGTGNGLVPAGTWTGSCAFGNCSANSAQIENYASGNQTFSFTSGSALQLTGGSIGNANSAQIESSTAQVISGNPAITLTGGSSGGTFIMAGSPTPVRYVFENDAGIDSNVSQTINAASITINGGSANYGGAYLSARLQNIDVVGNVSLIGGSASAPSAYPADGQPILTTAVAIGTDNENNTTSHTLNLTIGGSLTMQGGAVSDYGGSPALIGGYQIPANLTIDATGNIELSGVGAGRDMIGSYGGYGGSIHLHSSAGLVNLGQGFVGTGTTGSTHIEATNSTISQAATGQIKTNSLTVQARNTINLAGTLNVADITAITTAAGAITLNESDAVTLTNVTAFDGPITVTASGAVTALNVVSTNDAEANDIIIQGTSIAVTMVNAGANLGDVTLTATTGSITDGAVAETANVTGQVVDLNAVTGIGAAGAGDLNIVARTLTADTTNGIINLANVPGGTVIINSMTSGNASNITYKQTGQNLTIAGAISSGGGNIWIDPPVDIAINANVTTTGSGTILIQGSGAISTANGFTVSTETGTLTIEGATSGAEATSLTMADNSSISSTAGMITLRANAMTLDNVGTGVNMLFDSDAAAGTVITQLTGSPGKITANNLTIQQDDTSLVTIATAVTSLNVVGGNTVTMVEDNNIVVNSVVTAAAGTFNLTATTGAITNDDAGATPDIVTGTANLNAVGGIDVDTTVTSLTAATTGTGGNIQIDETNAITLTSMTTTDGAITVNAGGTMTASLVTAGGTHRNVTLVTTAGDINMGSVTAAGDTVIITAAGAIQSITPNGVADIIAAAIDLNAATGIGSVGGALDVTGTTISADTTNGAIDIDSLATGTVTATSLTTTTGNITFDQTGTQMLTVTNANASNGDITVTNAGDTSLNIGTINATGYALLYATEGAITDGNSSESLNVIANHLEVWAKNGINLDTQVNSIVALNSTSGNIVLREADGASIYNVWNAGGTNQLSTASGTLTQATNNTGSTNTIGTGGIINYGSWNVSGGQSATSSANPRYTFASAGGMTEISMISPRSSASLTDPWLYLLDSSNNILAYNDDGGIGYGAMIRTDLPAATYTVVAATYSTGVSYPYAMTVGNASAGSVLVGEGPAFGTGETTSATTTTTTPPVDPCQVNPASCVTTTPETSLNTTFTRGTDLGVSGAAGDVTFDPNLKVAGGEITFTDATRQTTTENAVAKAENDIKQAEAEVKMAKTPIEKAKAEIKKTEAEGRKAEAEAKLAEGDTKRAEAEAKVAKTPADKARAEKRAEASKSEEQGKKAEVAAKKSEAEAKKSEAEVKQAEVEEKNAQTPVEKAKAEVKKTEAEGRKAEAESRKAEAEAKKAEVEAKQADGEAKSAKSAEKKVEAEKKGEFKKAEADAKKAEADTKKAEAESKKAEAEAKSEQSVDKKAEAEKKAESKKAEVEKKKDKEMVKKAEAQKKEGEYKKAESERREAGVKSFGKMAVAAMSKDNLKAMLDIRHEFKTDTLKPALTILDRNPAAADMSACGAGESGACIQQPAPQIASALLPAPAIPQFAFLPQIQRKVAVVIGVNKYQDKTIPPLEGAVPDANAVSKMFKDNMGYEVRVIHDGTKGEIVQAINKVAGDVGANDSVTIYYAGHGYEVESTKTGYWIPSDGSAKSPANWISSNDINKMLGNIKAKQVLLVSDSCFSGNLAKEQKVSAVQGTAEDILGKRSVIVMSSGGDEPVSDEGRDGHSVFAWHFMDKLKGVNKYEQGSKLYEGVKAGVTADGFPQTPQYGASVTAGHSTGGDYLFELRK